ncbi:hypothetical protein Gotur_003800 [Gossypium turneri]
MAFSGGMRFCVEADFSKLQMAVFLHCLVTKYNQRRKYIPNSRFTVSRWLSHKAHGDKLEWINFNRNKADNNIELGTNQRWKYTP